MQPNFIDTGQLVNGSSPAFCNPRFCRCSTCSTPHSAEAGFGAVAEIGVHHGKLFIGLSLLQRPR